MVLEQEVECSILQQTDLATLITTVSMQKDQLFKVRTTEETVIKTTETILSKTSIRKTDYTWKFNIKWSNSLTVLMMMNHLRCLHSKNKTSKYQKIDKAKGQADRINNLGSNSSKVLLRELNSNNLKQKEAQIWVI